MIPRSESDPTDRFKGSKPLLTTNSFPYRLLIDMKTEPSIAVATGTQAAIVAFSLI